MKKKLELHVHTTYSKDSILTFPFLLLMCKIKGINCIVITDHNEISGAEYYRKKLKKHKIDVIVGEEIFTSKGEIIGLFLKEKIEPMLSPKETVNAIKNQGGYVYIPHPFDTQRKKSVLKDSALQKIIDDVDFIECHNGRNVSLSFSKKQKEIAKKYDKIGVVGSDAHTFYELGRNYCLVNSYCKEIFKEEISKATFFTKKCIKAAHFNTKIARAIKLIKRGEWNELYRIIKRKFKKRSKKIVR